MPKISVFKKTYTLVGKFAASKFGRKVLLNDFGNKQVNNLSYCVEQYYDKDISQKVIKILIKLVIKFKQFHDERKIIQKDVLHLSEPMHQLFINFYEMLKAKIENEMKLVDASVLCRLGTHFANKIYNLIEPFLKEKNKIRVNWLFDTTIKNNDFIQFVLTNDLLQDKRIDMIDDLDILVSPLFADRDDGQCIYKSCQRKALQLSDIYFKEEKEEEAFEEEGKDSKEIHLLHYCLKHHYKMYLNLKENPRIDFY